MTAPPSTPSASPRSSLAFPRCWVAPFRHSEDGETKFQGQDMARTEVERECTWRGQHVGTSVESGELQPAHASVNRITEIIQPRLPLQKPPVQKRQVDVTPCCRAGREGGTCGQDARMGSREGFLEEGL